MAAAVSHSTPRILFVDDNEAQRFVFHSQIGRVARDSQFVCHGDSVASGSDAIEICKKNKYDIIIMDYNMPHMNGGEAASKILALNPTQYIIGFTGTEDPREIQDCLNAGMKEVIHKDWKRVMEVVKKFLSRKCFV